MNRVYCSHCGVAVERAEVDLEAAGDTIGRVVLSPPKLIPCGHVADPVQLDASKHYDEDMAEIAGQLRVPLLWKTQSKTTLVDRETLRIAVDYMEAAIAEDTEKAEGRAVPVDEAGLD